MAPPPAIPPSPEPADRWAGAGVGWALARQSGALLLRQRSLLWFPVLGALSCMAVLFSLLVPVVVLTGLLDGGARSLQPLHVLSLLVFYFANYLVITFFNAALSACVIERLRGGPASVRAGLGLALSRLPLIVAWASIGASLGVVMQNVIERAGPLGRLVTSLLGAAWSVATCLAIPALVVEQLGPIAAVQRSLELVRRTWGAAVVANTGLWLVVAGATLVSLLPLLVGAAVAVAAAGGPAPVWPLLAGLLGTIVLLTLVGLCGSTVRSIQAAALYEFAATRRAPAGFDEELLKRAFV